MAWKYNLDDGEVEMQVSKETLLSALTSFRIILSDYAVGIEPASHSVSFAVRVILGAIDHAVGAVERDYVPAVPDEATIDKIQQHVENMTAQQKTARSEGS